MAKSTMWAVLEKVEKAPTQEEKIKLLRENGERPVIDLLLGVFDARIKWLLPEGPVPYTASKRENIESALYSEVRKLYLFVQGGNNNLSQKKREMLFVQLLESLDEHDAKLLEFVKDKKLPFPSITDDLFIAAWPTEYFERIPKAESIPKPEPEKTRKVKEKKDHVKNETA